MTEIPINTISPDNDELPLLLQQVEAVNKEVERRAFLRFEARGGVHGCDRVDWLESQRELIFSPPARLSEDEREFRILLAVPGLAGSQIRINALPEAIIIDGEPNDYGQEAGERICFSEFSDRTLLRKIDLPQEIDATDVVAILDNGILEIVAKKEAPVTTRNVEKLMTARA